ncbi:hypothetical protein [Pontibacter chitinilyticus]|uniref:hypothetical protein n=1 Tax=Pontibacter chitinilyticus TaxID=2674989 RepID=UPI003219F251
MKLPVLSFYLLPALLLCMALSQPAYASKDDNTLKTGISYVWLSDYDSQGVMFSDRYSHYLGDRFAAGLNLGLLAASRYDEIKQLYTIKNTFYMGTLELSYDVIKNDAIRLRVGAGGSMRHRAEISSNTKDLGTLDGSVRHIKSSEGGYNAFLENDFGILKNGVAGGRIEYFSYAKGTPVFAIGLHIGFSF